jgi:hypothetical protein
MSADRVLPARPSLDSLRKQAKKLARDSALSLRDAQLAIAREYGFAGWTDLTAEVERRLGRGLEWAVTQAKRLIHDNDVERLKDLLAEYPALLSWHRDGEDGSLLGMATGAYGDAGDPQREAWFTRGACAELLLDAGAVVLPSVCESLIDSRARGLLQLFERKGQLPRTLKFRTALGDLDAVRAALDGNGHDLAAVNAAFLCACRFGHEAVAALLLDRAAALDPELATRVDASVGRTRFIAFLSEKPSLDFAHHRPLGPWQEFVMGQALRAVHDDNVSEFVRVLQGEPWLLGEGAIWFQTRLLEVAALNDRETVIVALLDLNPALLQRRPPPPSQAIEFAITYAHTHLIPLLTRIWPLPDDLPHAAAMGDLSRVKHWLRPNSPAPQRVLDTALAYSVINHHFEVADALLAHGADLNTNWNSHEPASILHHLVFEDDYDAMRYLIDRGIDMTIKDYRWNATAEGWARHGKGDEKMAQWLEDADRQRKTHTESRSRGD